MKHTVNRYEFHRAFEVLRPKAFSYAALNALFDHLEELDYEIELDVIAICCDYGEYASVEEILDDFGCENLDQLDHYVIPVVGGGFIVGP